MTADNLSEATTSEPWRPDVTAAPDGLEGDSDGGAVVVRDALAAGSGRLRAAGPSLRTGSERPRYPILEQISSPADIKALSLSDCVDLAAEVRAFIVESVTRTGGHLGSNLGVVELTIALHRVFDSPRDVLLFDTGHQSYVHKLLTGRMKGFAALKQAGGLSGYPNRAESEHDWIENSHASTALSYAHGLAAAFAATGDSDRRVVALVGDGALTGGMAYEALNNIGHAGERVVIVLNDNGRSYAPTVSKLSESLTQLRLNPSYGAVRARVSRVIGDIPVMGQMAGQSLKGLTAALRELVEPHVFFEALGVRYAGPLDGHDVGVLEQALRRAASWQGPIVLHVLTRKGKGYGPAEDDEVQCLHDFRAQSAPLASPGSATDSGSFVAATPAKAASYGEAFSNALLEAAEADPRVVGITAAMPGPTGLLPLEARFPDRFLDVGIAEQHAMTAAAGMALGGMRPVVAVYSTFLSRCFDQQNLDVGLHQAPVVICADRAGITGDDGPSHHGVLDMVLGLAIPGLSIFAPSEPAEIAPMLRHALQLPGPSLIRWPKTPAEGTLGAPGTGLASRRLLEGGGEVVLVGIGKMAARCVAAAELLTSDGIDPSVHDLRVVRPADQELVELAARARLVVTVEDGLTHGGAGAYLVGLVDQAADEAGMAPPRHLVLGVPTRYLPHAKPDEILHQLGLDAPGIAASVRAAVAAAGIEPLGSGPR